MKITETPSTTYKIRGIPEGGWADITIREWNGGGSFMCQSDFGTFDYVWGSVGPSTLREFLCGLDKDYFFKKTHPKDYREFSIPDTCRAIQADIMRQRHDREITKANARDAWEKVNYVEIHSSTEHGFFYRLSDTNVIDNIYGGDVSSIPTRKLYNPMCDMFWERVWPHITAYWKEQLK